MNQSSKYTYQVVKLAFQATHRTRAHTEWIPTKSNLVFKVQKTKTKEKNSITIGKGPEGANSAATAASAVVSP
jgi:hypothetical protein